MIGQAQQQSPRDDGYVSTYRPKSFATSVDAKIKDDPDGRREATKEQFGGEFTPEFMESLMTAANQQVAEYGPAGRGGIKVPAGGAWTNVGPYRSNWIQNGLRVNESDTGRVRNFLVHPTNADIVYVLKSSGGLWKTTNFSHPRPNWRPMSDNILSTSGGSVAFGKNPETLYLGTGDPFDPGVGGYIYKSTERRRDMVGGRQAGRLDDHPRRQGRHERRRGCGACRHQRAACSAPPTAARRGRPVLPVGFRVWSLQKSSTGWLAALAQGNGFQAPLLARSTDFGFDLECGGYGEQRLHGRRPHHARRRLAGDATVYAFASSTNAEFRRRICIGPRTAARRTPQSDCSRKPR